MIEDKELLLSALGDTFTFPFGEVRGFLYTSISNIEDSALYEVQKQTIAVMFASADYGKMSSGMSFSLEESGKKYNFSILSPRDTLSGWVDVVTTLESVENV
jgi:hypothetical protein